VARTTSSLKANILEFTVDGKQHLSQFYTPSLFARAGKAASEVNKVKGNECHGVDGFDAAVRDVDAALAAGHCKNIR
jgi:hypothetical protein